MCGYVALTTCTKYFPIMISLNDNHQGNPNAMGYTRDFMRLYIFPVGKSIFNSDFKHRISFPARQGLIYHPQCLDTQNTAFLRTAPGPRENINSYCGRAHRKSSSQGSSGVLKSPASRKQPCTNSQ